MSADFKDFNLTVAALKAKLAALKEETNLFKNSNSTVTIAVLRDELAALKENALHRYLEGYREAQSAAQLAATEVTDQAAAAGSAALPCEVTISRPASPRTEPPRAAELLVSWCVKNHYREALLDDLDEVFQRDLTKGMTVARAHLRYWGAALHSITPQLLAAAKRIGLFGIIADYARHILH